MIEVAHAADWVITGPVRPYSIESWQAAIDADSAGNANGLTCPGPSSRARRVPIDDLLDAAAAGVDGHRHAVALLGRPVAEVQPGVRDRLLARAPSPSG